jgi:hypothetical protein
MKKLRIRKWVKVVSFVGLVLVGSKMLSKETIITETVEVEKPIVITIEKEKIVEVEKVVEVEKKTTKATFENKNEQAIYDKSIELGLTEKQAVLLIAISRHETGHWTSKAFIEKNNFGGIMWKNATEIKPFASYEEGLTYFVKHLKNNYFGKGLDTIEKIGAIYCPVGAANDPNGLNKYWVGGVTKFYNNYVEKLGL